MQTLTIMSFAFQCFPERLAKLSRGHVDIMTTLSFSIATIMAGKKSETGMKTICMLWEDKVQE